MPHYITDDCTGCTVCIAVCPTDSIWGDKKVRHDISPETCIDCGACRAACPFMAIEDQYGFIGEKAKKNKKPLAFVDEEHCVGCEKCVERCPFDALKMVPVADPQSFWGIVEVIEKNCTGCRECEWACPYDAIFVYRRDEVPEWLKESKFDKAA